MTSRSCICSAPTPSCSIRSMAIRTRRVTRRPPGMRSRRSQREPATLGSNYDTTGHRGRPAVPAPVRGAGNGGCRGRRLSVRLGARRRGRNRPRGGLEPGGDPGRPDAPPGVRAGTLAATNMTPRERAAATVYTSGEHCPMCAAAHGWVGLGRIVYATSTGQTGAWLAELGADPAPVLPLAITDVVRAVVVADPASDLAGQVRDLHHRFRS